MRITSTQHNDAHSAPSDTFPSSEPQPSLSAKRFSIVLGRPTNTLVVSNYNVFNAASKPKRMRKMRCFSQKKMLENLCTKWHSLVNDFERKWPRSISPLKLSRRAPLPSADGDRLNEASHKFSIKKKLEPNRSVTNVT